MMPMTIIFSENENLAAAERGTTTRLMKKYTAMPYSTPERTAWHTRDGIMRLAATKTAAAENAITK